MVWKFSRFVVVRERESMITGMYQHLSWLQSVKNDSGPGLTQRDVDKQQLEIEHREWQLQAMRDARTRAEYIKALRLTLDDYWAIRHLVTELVG